MLSYNSNTNQVLDVTSRTQSPYPLNRLFASSPNRNYSLTGNDTFLVSPNLIWNNTTKSVQQIQIDFNNGQGFKTFTVGYPIPVTYEDTGVKKWIIKVQLSDNSWLYSYSPYYVSKISSNELSRYDEFNFDATIPIYWNIESYWRQYFY